MNTLVHVPLSAPARRVGFVDGSRDRQRPVARTLDEAFGPGARACVVVPMAVPMHPADRLVLRASVWAGAALVLLLIAERFL